MTNIIDLSAENRALGWAAIPGDCPKYFSDKIIERRSRMLATRNTKPPMSTAALRARVADIGAQIVADRIAETGIAIQFTDARGNVGFRGPSDEEWTLSQQKRAAELAAVLRNDAASLEPELVWSVRNQAWVRK